MVRLMYRQTEKPDRTDSHNFGNRDHTFNQIGIWSDKNPKRVLTGKSIY